MSLVRWEPFEDMGMLFQSVPLCDHASAAGNGLLGRWRAATGLRLW
jgi:hypothetical protein